MIWGAAAVGNAVYSGCRLKDVLETVGIHCRINNVQQLHVAFVSEEQVIHKGRKDNSLIYFVYIV